MIRLALMKAFILLYMFQYITVYVILIKMHKFRSVHYENITHINIGLSKHFSFLFKML